MRNVTEIGDAAYVDKNRCDARRQSNYQSQLQDLHRGERERESLVLLDVVIKRLQFRKERERLVFWM